IYLRIISEDFDESPLFSLGFLGNFLHFDSFSGVLSQIGEIAAINSYQHKKVCVILVTLHGD
ncbi:hypothetical protein ACVPRA_04030, partial [Salmonella enterica subsp. enterica serovar Enteritidis]